MNSTIILYALLAAGGIWVVRTIWDWFLWRRKNSLNTTNDALTKESEKINAKIKETTSKLESVKTEQESKTDAEVEEFWANRK